MIPFARVYEHELKAIVKLPHRELVLWLAVRLRAQNGWAIKRTELEKLTGIGKRHVQLVLTRLERKGFLRREFSGKRFDPWGRFRAVATIPGDRGTTIPHDRASEGNHDPQGSLHTFLGSDLRRSKTDHRPPAHAEDRVRCAAEPGGRAGDLQDDRMVPLVALCRELFPDVLEPERQLRRLLEIAPHAPLERLTHYLRHEASTSDAKYPLGAACTAKRWEAWQQRTKRRTMPAHDPVAITTGERVSAAELEAFAKRR